MACWWAGSVRHPSRGLSSLSEIDERAVSPVSAMPEGLPDLLQSRQQFLDLLRYLMQLRDQAEEVPWTNVRRTAERSPPMWLGVVLFDQFSCRACHASDRWEQVAGGSISVDRGPLLADVRSRWRPAMLIRYLEDPQAVKPGTACEAARRRARRAATANRDGACAFLLARVAGVLQRGSRPGAGCPRG